VEYIRREIKECWLVKKAIVPDVIEENCSCYPLFAEVPGYCFNNAGKLQGRAMPGSETKLLFLQQPAIAYYMYGPS